MRWATVVALAAVSALVACNGDDDGSTVTNDKPTFGSANEVADAASCADPKPAEQSLGIDYAKDRASCTVGDKTVTIVIYEDQDHQEQAVRQVVAVGCPIAQQVGLAQIPYVKGNLWVITPDDPIATDLVDQLADKLNAEATAVNC